MTGKEDRGTRLGEAKESNHWTLEFVQMQGVWAERSCDGTNTCLPASLLSSALPFLLLFALFKLTNHKPCALHLILLAIAFPAPPYILDKLPLPDLAPAIPLFLNPSCFF